MLDAASTGPDVNNGINLASWNIAAINNNPFEYWISSPDPRYDKLMNDVEKLLHDPNLDVPIEFAFSNDMFSDLLSEMSQASLGSLDKVETVWRKDLKRRFALNGFLRDKAIAAKRLTSMPDRITNTINLKDGSTRYRPSAISAYTGTMITLETWWAAWKQFMFHEPLEVFDSSNQEPCLVCNLLSPISRSKYPAVTVEEEEISVQLQILCLAIMDSIFLFILYTAGPNTWQDVRLTLCRALVYDKMPNTCRVIASSYADTHVFFIQEAAAAFLKVARDHPVLGERYSLLAPQNLDGKRDQNSLVLVHKQVFDDKSAVDVTKDVAEAVGGNFLAPGDLFVVKVRDRLGHAWLLASFHGDSNGLSTEPTLQALFRYARSHCPDARLAAGVDANTHSITPDGLCQGVEHFCAFLAGQRAASVWTASDVGPACPVRTTCSSRTALQTQANKATPMAERGSRRHQHLRDWIIAPEHHVEGGAAGFTRVSRDNTGKRAFVEDKALPSTDFPSDHAIISATARFRSWSSGRRLSNCSTLSSDDRPMVVGGVARPGRAPGDGKARTLYDYWGMKPLVESLGAEGLAAKSAAGLRKAGTPSQRSGADEGADLETLCGRFYQRFIACPRGADLDEANWALSRGVEESIWILFSSRPAAVAYGKAWFQSLMVVVGLAFTVEYLLYYQVAWATGLFSATSVALTADPAYWDCISHVGVLSDGIEVPAQSVTFDGATRVWRFSSPSTIDGWFIETDTASDGAGSFLWTRQSATGEWFDVQYPPWIPFRRVSAQRIFGTPGRKAIYLRPPLTWLLCDCYGDLFCGLGFLLSSVLGRFNQNRYSPYVLSIVLFIQGSFMLSHVVASILNVPVDGPVPVLVYVLFCAHLLLVGMMAFSPRYQVYIIALGTTLLSIGRLVQRYYFFPYVTNPFVSWVVVTANSFSLSVTFLALLVRKQLVQWWLTESLTREDRESFDALWAQLADDDAESRAISQLRAQCSSLSTWLAASHSQPLQLQSVSCLPSSGRVQDDAKRAAGGGVREPVGSLDQLYDQAALLDYFLRLKVGDLGRASGGWFRFAGEGPGEEAGFASWELPGDELEGVKGRIQWAPLKSPQRALEKLLRVYDSNAARVLDCCRQSIYFEQTEDIVRCVDLIASDEEIRVVRVKNRMAWDADSEFCCGFRNVIVNLSITSEATHRLGLDGHVCELQLTLKHFAQNMTAASHSRYLTFRNCRDAPDLARAAARGLRSLARGCSQALSLARSQEAEDVSSLFKPERRGKGAVAPNPRAALPARNHYAEPTLDDECSSAVEAVVLSAMATPFQVAGGRSVKDVLVENAVADAAASSVWDTCHPSAAAICKPWLPVFALAFALVTAADAVSTSMLAASNNEVVGRRFRFTALELRGGSSPIADPGVEAVGIFRKYIGVLARTQPQPSRETRQGASLVIAFDEDVPMNGWWFQTSRGDPALDPVRFRLEASRDASGDSWMQVGSSSAVWTWSSKLMWTDGRHETSRARLLHKWFYLGAVQAFIAFRLSLDFFLLVMCGWLVQLRRIKRPALGRYVICGVLFLTFVIFFLQFIYCMGFKQYPTALTSIGLSLFSFVFFLVFIFDETKLRSCLLFCGSGFILCPLSHYLYLFWARDLNPGADIRVGHEDVLHGLCLVAVGLTGYLASWRNRHLAVSIAAQDSAPYDSAWKALLYKDGSEQALDTLNAKLTELAGSLPRPVRQQISALKVVQFAGVYDFRTSLKYDSSDSSHHGPPSSPATAAHRPSACDLENGGARGVEPQASIRPSNSGLGLHHLLRNFWTWHDDAADQSSRVPEWFPVEHLDQLFAQASVVDIFLRRKVQQWALASRAHVRLYTGPRHGLLTRTSSGESSDDGTGQQRSFVPWRDVCGDPELRRRVHWASLKSYRRAVEKVYRCYGCEVARLLDVCRQALYFASAQDLLACFEALSADPDVRLCRVFNRLRPEYDSSESAGYRDLLLNLRIDSPETRRLGVHGHVCEVQLIPLELAAVKTDIGHARYVQWRNQRGQ